MGDLVFASSLVAPLRQQFPDAKISLLCKEYTAAIAPLINGLSEAFAADPFWDTSPGQRKGSLLGFLGMLWRIRRQNFDFALVASRSWRQVLAARACAVPSGCWLKGKRPSDKPVLEDLAQLLAPFHISEKLVYRLDPAPLNSKIAALQDQAKGKPLATLHPFAGDPRRCVSLSEWLKLGHALEQNGFTIFWVGNATEAAALEGHLSKENLRSWRLTPKLLDLAAAIAASKLFVGHDSGPLHVAAALQVPSLGIYTPGEPARTFPQGAGKTAMIAKRHQLDVVARDMLAAAQMLIA